MCGLVGAYGASASRLAARIGSALEAIAHRGPDARGEFVSSDGRCLLGHVRLSIVDLNERANQPMLTDALVLAYNGEIYNHRALRTRIGPLSAFATGSDTETLLRGLEREGAGFLDRLEGMFAGAAYDRRDGSLTLFRDGLGIKPLHVAMLEDGTWVFASEIKALFALAPSLKPRLDPKVLSTYLQFENFPPGPSLFAGLRLMLPGEVLRLSGERVTRAQIAETPGVAIQRDFDGLAAETRERVSLAVREHLMADVPLGVYLSGGIDSSLVATIAAREAPGMLGFTGYFETGDPHYDERPVARAVARAAGIELVERAILPQDLIDCLDSVVLALDEPRMGMGAFSQYVVAREAARHRKVILAGHGGDELFAGYPAFKAFWLLDRGLSTGALGAWSKLRGKELPFVVNAAWRRALTGERAFAPRLGEAFEGLARDSRLEARFAPTGRAPEGDLAALARYYREVYLPGLLMVEDRISMAHGLETRVPLWSQKLVAWASAIPLDLRLRGGELKALLRAAARPILPPEVFSAPKRGFPTPLRLWFRRELHDFVRGRLLSGDSPLTLLVKSGKVERLLTAHRSRPLPFALDERRAHRIWMLLCLDSWLRQFGVEVQEDRAA